MTPQQTWRFSRHASCPSALLENPSVTCSCHAASSFLYLPQCLPALTLVASNKESNYQQGSSSHKYHLVSVCDFSLDPHDPSFACDVSLGLQIVLREFLNPRGWKPSEDSKFFLDAEQINQLCDVAEQILQAEPSVLRLKGVYCIILPPLTS